MTVKPEDRLYSVREAAKFIGCSVSTLQRDISSGLLVPYELAPRRHPRGSRLDFSDLVLARCFRVLASAGVLLSHIGESTEGFAREFLSSFNQLPLEIRERSPLFVGDNLHKRIMQLFLQAADFNAVLAGMASADEDDPEEPLVWIIMPIWNEVLESTLINHFHYEPLLGKPIVLASAEVIAGLLRKTIGESP